MIHCGNCGKRVDTGDITCPNCDALLAAWLPAARSSESNDYEQPTYAKAPPDTPPFPAMDSSQLVGSSHIFDFAQEQHHNADGMTLAEKAAAARFVNTINMGNKAAASSVVNTIRAYARKREAESSAARSSPVQRHAISPIKDNQDSPTSNIVFAIGIVLVVVLMLMWGIVAAMVFSDMRSVEFIAITIVLTLTFKPTMNVFRRLDRK